MTDKGSLFYVSAALAINATVGYHFFVKKIPTDINPLVSVIGIYVVVLVAAVVLVPFFVPKGEFMVNVQRLGWVQATIGIIVLGMELGFLLMYRYGWDLSLGNVVTGVVINIVLMAIGLLFLGEQLGRINIMGIMLCIVGVAMIGYRSPQSGEDTTVAGATATAVKVTD